MTKFYKINNMLLTTSVKWPSCRFLLRQVLWVQIAHETALCVIYKLMF